MKELGENKTGTPTEKIKLDPEKNIIFRFFETILKDGSQIEWDEEVFFEFEIQKEEKGSNIPFEIKLQSVCFLAPNGEVTDIDILSFLQQEHEEAITSEILDELN